MPETRINKMQSYTIQLTAPFPAAPTLSAGNGNPVKALMNLFGMKDKMRRTVVMPFFPARNMVFQVRPFAKRVYS